GDPYEASISVHYAGALFRHTHHCADLSCHSTVVEGSEFGLGARASTRTAATELDTCRDCAGRASRAADLLRGWSCSSHRRRSSVLRTDRKKLLRENPGLCAHT